MRCIGNDCELENGNVDGAKFSEPSNTRCHIYEYTE
jgi:hypothetical protein